MAQLTVRNLDDETVAALKARAVEHGRSAEAEHRQILRTALREPAASGDFFAAAAALRARIGRVTADGPSTTEILRADRGRTNLDWAGLDRADLDRPDLDRDPAAQETK